MGNSVILNLADTNTNKGIYTGYKNISEKIYEYQKSYKIKFLYMHMAEGTLTEK